MIVLQTPVRYYPNIGGVENHVMYLAEAMLEKGIHTHVVCANEPPSKPSEVIHGIKISRLPYIFKITNTNISVSLVWRLLTETYDLVHTHMPTPWTSDWSILMAKLRRKKTVLTIHNDMDKPDPVGKLLTMIYLNTIFRITIFLVDRIIIVNPNWKKAFTVTHHILSSHKNKITCIPNGVDTELFKPHLFKKSVKKRIVFISVLDKHHRFKGFPVLYEAFRQMINNQTDIELLVIGDGELKHEYVRLSRLAGTENFIKFVGSKSPHEIAKILPTCDVLCLPSTEIEGFGMVTLEAMACGLPVVISSKVALIKDVVKYKCGFVVDPNNPLELTKYLNKILSSRPMQKIMGNNSRNLATSKYTWSAIAERTVRVYRSIK